jgi:hypothetical protein
VIKLLAERTTAVESAGLKQSFTEMLSKEKFYKQSKFFRRIEEANRFKPLGFSSSWKLFSL